MADNGGAAFDPPCAPWRALVNLTGTPLTIVHSDSGAETYLASSGFAQVTCNKACVGVVHGVQLLVETATVVAGIPPYDPAAGTLYIVTALAASALRNRPDIVRPGEARRAGRTVTGCFGLVLACGR